MDDTPMDFTPVVLGINRSQDASICLMHGSHLAWAIQKERLTRRKHHWGKPGDLRDHYLPRLSGLERPVDIVIECYPSDEAFQNLPQYEDELAATLSLAHGNRRARISHHLAHLYSVFHPSPFDAAAVMVIDGRGSPVSDFTEHCSGTATTPGGWREVSSFYMAGREAIRCIGKQVWDRDEERLVGLGMQFAAPVRPEVAPMLPAITHVDGTARLQTVGPAEDPLLRALLAGFEVRTGVPVLLNTSFNDRDEPIVETPFEAVAAFRQMPLHALAIPPFLVTKRSEPELPA